MPNVNYLAYKNALKQAWKDGRMSANESAILDTLRKSLNISAEDHMEIERNVRAELDGKPIENGELEFNSVSNNLTEEPEPSSVPEQPEQLEQPEQPEQPEPNPEPSPNESDVLDTPNENKLEAPKEPEAPAEVQDIKTLLDLGKNAYHKGNYEKAIEYCDKVVLMDPENSEALFFRKRTLSKIEKAQRSAGSAQAEAIANSNVETAKDPASVSGSGEVAGNPGDGSAGTGDPNCKSCGGSGQCHWCKGTGKCYWCKGTGNCDKCSGQGQIDGEECKSCKGSGKCHSCNGDSTCYWCKSSGKCSRCAM